jgi:D-lactate dehydrogenase
MVLQTSNGAGVKVAIFSTQDFERDFFNAANKPFRHELTYYRERLHEDTARMAAGYPAVCAFVTDRLDGATLSLLAAGGTRLWD